MFPKYAKLILVVVVEVADLLKNLFLESLMGATIQDGGTRARRDDHTSLPKSKIMKMKTKIK